MYFSIFLLYQGNLYKIKIIFINILILLSITPKLIFFEIRKKKRHMPKLIFKMRKKFAWLLVFLSEKTI